MPIDDSFSSLGRTLVASYNADQAEMAAMNRGFSSVNASLLDERISGSFDDDEGSNDRVQGDALVAEELAGSTLELLQHRISLLRSQYPFRIDGQVLEYTGNPRSEGIYEFCLRLSQADLGENSNSTELVIFELLSAKVVAKNFGGHSYRCGWPTHDPTDRPHKLKGVGARLHEQTGEWRWAPRQPNPDDPTTAQAKDEGIDFVVWKRLDPYRHGSFFIAGQCAGGRHWRNKLQELNLARIQRWWSHPCHVPLTRAFSIPFVIPGNLAIEELSAQAGLIFDRIRLTLAGGHNAVSAGPNSKSWGQWIDEQRDLIERQRAA